VRNYEREIMNRYKFTVDQYQQELNRQIRSKNDVKELSKSQDKQFWKEATKKVNDEHQKCINSDKMKKENNRQTFLKENGRIMDYKNQKKIVIFFIKTRSIKRIIISKSSSIKN
jgi:hypothetical protein